MQRTAKAVVSLILMLMMVISILPITAASASSAAAVDPKKIDKVVVDMRSEAAFSELAHIYEHTPTASEPDPYTGGKYSFSDTMKAMRVEYNGNQSAGNTFRIMPAFNEAKTVTMDYKYWVIVYAAKTNKDYSLTLFNSPKFGEQVTVTENGIVEYKNYLDCAYQTFSFVSDENGNTVLLCHDETNTPIPFDLTINNGLVLVTHPDPAVTFGMSYHEPEA